MRGFEREIQDMFAGWKPGRLTINASCLCCKEALKPGSDVRYAGKDRQVRLYICQACWDEYTELKIPLKNLHRWKESAKKEG